MKKDFTDNFIKQLDQIIDTFNKCSTVEYGNGSYMPNFSDSHQIVSSAQAAIERISGTNSSYDVNAREILNSSMHVMHKVDAIMGIVRALRGDLESGYLDNYTELVHSDLFSDYLEMAAHLISEGYKDASAVIAGSTLEAHLKKLCLKNGIDIIVVSDKGNRPKNVETLNSDLTKKKVYSSLDQKNISAWYSLRTQAAHGNYSEYNAELVTLMIAGVRDFITRNPA